MKFLKIPTFLALFFVIFSCKKEIAQISHAVQPKDTAASKTLPAPALPPVDTSVKYTAMVFGKGKNDSVRKAFENFSPEEQKTVLMLNRIDKEFLKTTDTLIVPDKFNQDFISYSPFPAHVATLEPVNKFVIFSYPIQAYAVYEKGILQKWGPTSTGKKSAKTRRGLMFANWKKELAISTVKDEWKLPYNFNIANFDGIGWHQYALPGYPASHSCLRLTMDDAKWLFDFADQWVLKKGGAEVRANGTPVIVYGDYNWGGRKPWRNLLEDPKANTVTEQQMDDIIKPHLQKILAEQQNREEVLKTLPQEKKSADSASA